MERLLEVERTARWRGSKALVVIEPGVCPACGGPLNDFGSEQLPLLRHGGYGAASRTTVASCKRCPWAMTREVSETRPPR